jgi:hypothetical protein
MVTDMMDYNAMVQDALRGVVRKALDRAAEEGLPGQHHFYIGFRTADPGVVIPDHLRASHPDEMTIVLQHQFWGLEIDDNGFAITLSFNKHHERLHIPFAALTSFYDPSVQFGLQFPGPEADSVQENDMPKDRRYGGQEAAVSEPSGSDKEAAESPPEGAGDAPVDNIVTLDTFRKD